MKHLVISEFGTFLGVRDSRLAIKYNEEIKYYPLSRLRTVTIAKRGISISSDLIEQFALRGIKLFFSDFRGVPHTMLSGTSQHAVVKVRIAQQEYCTRPMPSVCYEIIKGKISNQKAVLSYFNKYHKNEALAKAITETGNIADNINSNIKNKEILLGMEGSAARIYFEALATSELMPSSFKNRQGRGSREITNVMLNLGYAILGNYVMNCIINAGLEPYLGFLHTQRPGKPSLVLDLMEEYRAWVVDREVVKLRTQAEKYQFLHQSLKVKIISAIQDTMQKKYLYKKKRVRLEYIIQRQLYRLSGHFQSEAKYRSYRFKW